jgi:hypothetical protein
MQSTTFLRAFGALLLLASAGCEGSPGRPSPSGLIGDWGGDHVRVTVTETGTHLEFDCAHGDSPQAWAADARGAFASAGTYVREHGGPIREGELLDAHPAIYSGTVKGSTLALIVRLTDTNDDVGTFTLARDAPGRIVKCL